MPKTPDFFRDFGILPYGKTEPPKRVRSFFSTGTVIGQFIGTGLMLAFGLGMALLLALLLPFLNCAEMIRAGIFGNAINPHYDAGYTFMVDWVMIVVGLLLIRRIRDRVDVI